MSKLGLLRMSFFFFPSCTSCPQWLDFPTLKVYFGRIASCCSDLPANFINKAICNNVAPLWRATCFTQMVYIIKGWCRRGTDVCGCPGSSGQSTLCCFGSEDQGWFPHLRELSFAHWGGAQAVCSSLLPFWLCIGPEGAFSLSLPTSPHFLPRLPLTLRGGCEGCVCTQIRWRGAALFLCVCHRVESATVNSYGTLQRVCLLLQKSLFQYRSTSGAGCRCSDTDTF